MKSIGSALLVATLAASSSGFSLLGPYTSWQVPQIGYNVAIINGADLGGPMGLGEEYRLNVPLLTYGFDASFLLYFGTNGVNAVDAAFRILNDIPHVTQMSADLSEFPLNSKLVNFQARALGILDLKSTVLGTIVAQMGLGNPERYAWTLRSRGIIGTGAAAVTNYLVVRRNFDPITLAPSSFVNGTLYTYDIREFVPPQVPQQFSDAVERPVDPQASTYTSVANADDSGGGNFLALTVNSFALGLNSGELLTGLTRDDVGGLRYLMRFNNFNIESLAPGVTNVVRSNSVFGPPGPGAGLASPYGPTFTGTNVAFNPTNTATNSIIVGLRPGIGRVSFQRLDFDSFLYTVVSRPVTNQFIDVVITNSVVTNQLVQRIITFPDILFTASDLGIIGNTAIPRFYERTVIQGRWINNAATNFITGVGPIVPPGGPGVIPPGTGAAGGAASAGIVVTFSTITPSFINQTPFFLSEANASPSLVWGYFDAANIFAIFPTTTSLQELEALMLRP